MIVDLISVLGSVASTVALFLTWRVYVRLKSVERSYLRQAILPEHLLALESHVANIGAQIRQNDARLARSELSLCRGTLESLSPLLPAEHRRRVASLIERIGTSLEPSNATTFIHGCNRLHDELQSEVSRLNAFRKELPWRQRDGE